MKALLAVLLLAGCGPGPVCKTRCGLEFRGMTDSSPVPYGWECDAFQRAEDVTLEAFGAQVVNDERFRPAAACGAVSQFRVFLHPEEFWFSPEHGVDIGGVTYCHAVPPGLVVGMSNTPQGGALAHELAHAIQGCDPRFSDPTDPMHAGWYENGIVSAIDSVRAR